MGAVESGGFVRPGLVYGSLDKSSGFVKGGIDELGRTPELGYAEPGFIVGRGGSLLAHTAAGWSFVRSVCCSSFVFYPAYEAQEAQEAAKEQSTHSGP